MPEQKEWMKQIFQMVMVVNDLDETIENWKRFVEFDEASIKLGTMAKGKYAAFDLGGVEMKLVEPLNKEGGDPYSDSLLKSGPGIHHIGFCTEDYDGLLEKYSAAGQKPVLEEVCGDKRYVLFDFTEQTGLKIAPWDHMEGPCARWSMEKHSR